MAERSERDVVWRIYRNLGRLLGGKAGAGLLSLAYLAVAARALGPADYGVLILVHAYVLTVVDHRVGHAVVRYSPGACGGRPSPAHPPAGLRAWSRRAPAGGGRRQRWRPSRAGWSRQILRAYSLAVLASIRATPAGYLRSSAASTCRVHTRGGLVGSVVAVASHAGLRSSSPG